MRMTPSSFDAAQDTLRVGRSRASPERLQQRDVEVHVDRERGRAAVPRQFGLRVTDLVDARTQPAELLGYGQPEVAGVAHVVVVLADERVVEVVGRGTRRELPRRARERGRRTCRRPVQMGAVLQIRSWRNVTPRISVSFTSFPCGVSISPSGRKKRQNTIPKPRPSVSIQLGTPGSSCAITMRKLPSGSSVVFARFRLAGRCA